MSGKIYRIELKKSVRKDVRKIPSVILRRILQRIYSLGEDPFPPDAKKLHGERQYRIRVGQYRIIYEIAEHIRIITIIRIGHRKDVYRGL